jgi:hypothetical protein
LLTIIIVNGGIIWMRWSPYPVDVGARNEEPPFSCHKNIRRHENEEN